MYTACKPVCTLLAMHTMAPETPTEHLDICGLQWEHGAMGTWYIGNMVQWDHGAVGSWCSGNMVQWEHGAMGTWRMKLPPNAVGTWCSGNMVQWEHGAMGTWRLKLAPNATHSMICSQCELLREQFNIFRAADLMPVRHLHAMLQLGEDPEVRKSFSFLCSGTHLKGPIALSVVDPTVLPMDFDHAPPCKWHWAVNMASDLMDNTRRQLEAGGRQQRAKAKVPPPIRPRTSGDTLPLPKIVSICQAFRRHLCGMCAPARGRCGR